jgi:hypothetical protein
VHQITVARRQLEGADRRIRQPRCDDLGRVGLGRRRLDPRPRDVGVDVALHVGRGLVGDSNVLFQVIGKQHVAPRGDTLDSAEQHDTLGAERLQADRVDGAEQPPRRDASGRLQELGPGHVQQPLWSKQIMMSWPR